MRSVGKLLYGAVDHPIEFDDRVLAHLQFVISVKLRRKEGFFLTWHNDWTTGGGRDSIWLDTTIPLRIEYASRGRHLLNRAWLDELAVAANQATGLTITSEPTSPVDVVAHENS